ncbi:MAG TPA: glycosyltransferase family 2 protein [Clostridium sp.]
MNCFVAGIVLYNPDLKRLKENINAIYSQVSKIVLIDNASDNIDEVENLYKGYKNIVIEKNTQNKGIARGLNQIVQFAEKEGYDWVLTLDQDSVSPNNLIEEYTKYLYIEKLAIVSPIIIDRNRDYGNESCVLLENNKYSFIDTCITSASLINVSVCRKLNCFDEIMFIDGVDFDYCKRVVLNGYKIIRANAVSLIHEIGHIKIRKFLFWNVIVRNHSAFRKYYIARNILYFDNKYRKPGSRFTAYLRVLKLGLVTLLYEEDKINKIMAIAKGVHNNKV